MNVLKSFFDFFRSWFSWRRLLPHYLCSLLALFWQAPSSGVKASVKRRQFPWTPSLSPSSMLPEYPTTPLHGHLPADWYPAAPARWALS